MRKFLLCILVCALLSGCSLFKRVEKRTDKSKSSAKVEAQKEAEKSEVVNFEGSKQTHSSGQSTEQEYKDINENTTLTADEISVGADGSIKGKGNAKLKTNKKDKGVVGKTSNNNSKSNENIKGSIDTKEKEKERVKQEDKQSDVVIERKEEPSGWGLIIGTVCALLFVFGILLYFGIKPKKPLQM